MNLSKFLITSITVPLGRINNNTMNILVTGSAGFIGANLVLRLLDSPGSINIVGLDNLNDYYDPSLKEYRLNLISQKYAQRALTSNP